MTYLDEQALGAIRRRAERQSLTHAASLTCLAAVLALAGCGTPRASAGDGLTDASALPDVPDDAGEAAADAASRPDADAADPGDAVDDGSDQAGDDVAIGAACTPCVSDTECAGGACVALEGGRVCLDRCPRGGCGDGFDCRAVAGYGTRCVPSDDACGCVDDDGDGFSVGVGCGAVDCAVDDPSVYPGAPEACDGADDDCDGRIDEDFDLTADPANCGACDSVCAGGGAAMRCDAGRCVVDSCDDGFVDCNRDPADGCETAASALNACGGCIALPEPLGEACGTCASGTYACAGPNRIVCVGDLGVGARNACGGCGTLGTRVGAVCGACDRGRVVCDGEDATRCVDGADAGLYVECGDGCCGPGERCIAGVCGEDAGCTDDDECGPDAYCYAELGVCLPWGTAPRGDFDEACTRDVTIARFSPRIQCAWEGPPTGDAYPAWQHVLSTPMVADFDFDGVPSRLRPSIVFTSDDGVDGSSELPTGVIRIIDGRTCEQQFSLDAQLTSHSSPPAIGDLDGDGTPEVVAYKARGGLVAFRYDRASATWGVLWRSTRPGGAAYEPSGGGWGGPAIHDLDDDGFPEVLRGGVVVDGRTGVLIDDSIGLITAGAAPANMSAAADYDEDGTVEIVSGNNVWGWDRASRRWVAEPYFVWTALNQIGFVAVADLGPFAAGRVALANPPEVVIAESGRVRVQALDGTLILPNTALPGPSGTGGPPTIADFDGDGFAEFGVAGRGSYTVFDLDCVPGLRGGACASRRTDAILWTREAQDFSSSQTGSSVFDFEGDGRAEAIYADECFVRVYDGTSGEVIFSQFRSSCTWNENPIVADVDGDFNAELVVPSNLNCGVADLGVVCQNLEAGGVDPQFNGLRCEADADCVSDRCDAGLCRCAATSECCSGDCGAFGWVCAPPRAGTPGSGNTCRAAHPRGARGIRVYSDALDQWVGSRPVWNQHAYFVTHVNDDATIPRTSDVAANWRAAGLNNYRQNVQGDVEEGASPDVTVRAIDGARLYCDGGTGGITFEAVVCNRGTEPLPDGVAVGLVAGESAASGSAVCTAVSRDVLLPGACEDVGCSWANPPDEPPGVDVWVVGDPDGEYAECREGNNLAVLRGVYCRGG